MLIAELRGGGKELLLVLGPARPQQLIDLHHDILRHIHQFGGALEVFGELGPSGIARDIGLRCESRRRDAQVSIVTLACQQPRRA